MSSRSRQQTWLNIRQGSRPEGQCVRAEPTPQAGPQDTRHHFTPTRISRRPSAGGSKFLSQHAAQRSLQRSDLDLITSNGPLPVFTLLHGAGPVLLNFCAPGFDITPKIGSNRSTRNTLPFTSRRLEQLWGSELGSRVKG